MPSDHHLLLHYIELIAGVTAVLVAWRLYKWRREAKLRKRWAELCDGQWHLWSVDWHANASRTKTSRTRVYRKLLDSGEWLEERGVEEQPYYHLPWQVGSTGPSGTQVPVGNQKGGGPRTPR